MPSSSTAARVLVPGRAMPIASMHVLMVLAVNIPLHVPEPGHALHSMALKSSMSMIFCDSAPSASNGLRCPIEDQLPS